MADLIGQPAELRFTLEVKRAATGKTEKFEMVGYIDPPKPVTKEDEHGSNPHDSSP